MEIYITRYVFLGVLFIKLFSRFSCDSEFCIRVSRFSSFAFSSDSQFSIWVYLPSVNRQLKLKPYSYSSNLNAKLPWLWLLFKSKQDLISVVDFGERSSCVPSYPLPALQARDPIFHMLDQYDVVKTESILQCKKKTWYTVWYVVFHIWYTSLFKREQDSYPPEYREQQKTVPLWNLPE